MRCRMSQTRCVALAALAVGFALAPGLGGAADKPGWNPPRDGLGEVAPYGLPITAAEHAEMRALAARVSDLFRHAEHLVAPAPDLTIRELHRWFGWQRFGERRTLASYGVSFAFNTSKPHATDAGFGTISVMVNAELEDFPGNPGRLALLGETKYLPVTDDLADDHPVYGRWSTGMIRDEVGVWISAHDDLPFLPVSREQYLRSLAAEVAGSPEQQAAWKKATAKTPYQQWLDEAPKRKKEREALLATLKATDPSHVDEMRETIEKTDRDVEAGLKASEERDRAEIQESARGQSEAARSIEAKIDALSPAERTMPAWTIGEGGGQVVAPRTEYACQVVIPNERFYLTKGSVTRPCGILVLFVTPDPEFHLLFRQVFESLDWEALRRLVVPAR